MDVGYGLGDKLRFLTLSCGFDVAFQDKHAVLGVKIRALLVKGSARLCIERFTPDIAFIDPPYDLDSEYHAILEMLGRL